MGSLFLEEKQSANEVCAITKRAAELSAKGIKKNKAISILKKEFKNTKLSWINYLVNFDDTKKKKVKKFKLHTGNSQTCHQKIDSMLSEHKDYLINLQFPVQVQHWSIKNVPDCDPKLVIDWWSVQKKMMTLEKEHNIR